MSSGVVDEAVYRLEKAFKFLSILWFLIALLPVVLLFDLIRNSHDFVEEGNHTVVEEHSSLICFSYFAIFEALIHGDPR